VSRLALAQPRSVRDALAVPWRRLPGLALGLAAALALLYLGARETSVFAVRTIEVSGGPPSVREAVRAAAAPVAGESLAALDGDALLADLEALPSVRSATYDRVFPTTLRIFVQPEHPVAVVHVGPDSWILSERGRVIRSVPADTDGRLPEFRLPDGPALRPGAFVTDPTTRLVLDALTVVPRPFPARISSVRLESGILTLGLQTEWGEPELRLGDPVDIEAKLAAAALVLRSLTADEEASAGYVDVSVPERTVVGPKPQPEG
jgi:cell division septal protein FtsQ